jgi:hypothetical protein
METLNQIENLLLQVGSINKSYEKIAKITGENFNMFKILGLSTSEVRLHSSFLAELLNPNGAHEKGNLFIKAFIELLKDILLKGKIDIEISFDSEKVKNVIAEHWLGYLTESQGGYIDILLTDKNNQHIIIENKIYAGDQRNQLLRYHSDYPEAPIVYLTLDGKGPSGESTTNNKRVLDKLICISYKSHILPWLESCKKNAVDHPVLRETITQYINLIKELTHQTMKNEEKTEIVSAIIANPNYLAALVNLNDNNIFYDVKMKILSDLGNKILVSMTITQDTGLLVKGEEKILFGLKFSGFWVYKESWKYCIYFAFENDFEPISYGIDVINPDQNKREETERLKFKAILGESLKDNSWIWKSNLQEYDDMSWYEVISKGEGLFKEKIIEILQKVENYM